MGVLTVVPVEYAQRLVGLGYAVVPPAEDGTKRPAFGWREFQAQPPTLEQVGGWYGTPRHGIGVLCGAASGGLEMLELEGRAIEAGMLMALVRAVEAAGVIEAWRRVVDGYVERTPSGGLHLLFRVLDGPNMGNTKLARDTAGTCLVETRGEGGYVVLAPSGGPVHATGAPWALTGGDIGTVATITVAERDALYAACMTLDAYREAHPPEPVTAAYTADPIHWPKPPMPPSWVDAVVEAFNTGTAWADVLAGWSVHHTQGTETYWTRPGKPVAAGYSATTNANGTDRLTVFSSSVPGFKTYDGVGLATTYDRFGAWAVIHHNGDRVEAARIARARGYGPPERRTGVPEFVDPAEPWPEPTKLVDAIDRPTFPLEALPAWCQAHTQATALRVQTPVDLPAMLCIGALSAAITGRAYVEWGNGYHQWVNLYLCTAMPSGAGKSPAASNMTRWLTKFEREQRELARPVVAAAKQRVRLAEKALQDAERGKVDEMEARAALEAVAEAEAAVPAMPRYVADDATPEAIAGLLAAHEQSLAIMSTEAELFDMVTNPRQSPNINVYLKAWGGDPLTRDRKGSQDGGPELAEMERPLMTISVCCQPSVLAVLHRDTYLLGRGFPQRFMVTLPQSNIGRRDLSHKFHGADTTSDTYSHRATALATEWATWTEAKVLRPTDEARTAMLQWEQEAEARLLGDLYGFAEYVAKLNASVERYAGLLHLAEGWDPAEPIGLGTTVRALALGDYWLGHLNAVMALGGPGNPDVDGALHIARWLEADTPETFTATDLQRHVRTGPFKTAKAKDYAKPLAWLMECGWIRAEDPLWLDGLGNKGTPSPVFHLTPHPFPISEPA